MASSPLGRCNILPDPLAYRHRKGPATGRETELFLASPYDVAKAIPYGSPGLGTHRTYTQRTEADKNHVGHKGGSFTHPFRLGDGITGIPTVWEHAP